MVPWRYPSESFFDHKWGEWTPQQSPLPQTVTTCLSFFRWSMTSLSKRFIEDLKHTLWYKCNKLTSKLPVYRTVGGNGTSFLNFEIWQHLQIRLSYTSSLHTLQPSSNVATSTFFIFLNFSSTKWRVVSSPQISRMDDSKSFCSMTRLIELSEGDEGEQNLDKTLSAISWNAEIIKYLQYLVTNLRYRTFDFMLNTISTG